MNFFNTVITLIWFTELTYSSESLAVRETNESRLCLTVFTDNTSLKCESLSLFHAECTLPLVRMERVQEAAEWKLKDKKVNASYRGLELKEVMKEVHYISYGQGVLHYLRYPVLRLVKEHIIYFLIFYTSAFRHNRCSKTWCTAYLGSTR